VRWTEVVCTNRDITQSLFVGFLADGEPEASDHFADYGVISMTHPLQFKPGRIDNAAW
jgi:hypothetical protein